MKESIEDVERRVTAELQADPRYGWMFMPYPKPPKAKWYHWAVIAFPWVYIGYHTILSVLS